MEGHTGLGDPSDEEEIEEDNPEPSDDIVSVIDLKEGIEVTEGSEDTLDDILDVDIDLFDKRTAMSRTNQKYVAQFKARQNYVNISLFQDKDTNIKNALLKD